MTTPPKPSRWIAFLPALSGLLLGLSFPPIDWHWLAWIALVPMAWCWAQPALPRSAYWSAFGGGILSHLMALSWLRTTYHYDTAWLGPYADVWLTISMLCAIAFLAMFWYGRVLTCRLRLPMTLLLPTVWVSYEFVRFYVGILFDQTGFPWAKLAMTQAREGVFLQIADLGGEYLLSFFIAMVSGAIMDGVLFWQRRTVVLPRGGEPPLAGRMVGPLVAVLLLVAVVGYGRWRVSQNSFQSGPVVCLMGELDLPPLLDPERIAQAIADKSDGSKQTNAWPDLLLWPELAWHHKLLDQPREAPSVWPNEVPSVLTLVSAQSPESYSQNVKIGLTKASRKMGSVIVIGCERYQANSNDWHRYNSLVCVSPRRGVVGSYDKRFPVPWAEFVPYDSRPGACEGDSYRRGEDAKRFEIAARGRERTFRCMPALCYDLCFASLFRSSMIASNQEASADFILHSGAEGQDATGVLSEWMLRAARLRAVETRRAVVRNISHGRSGIVDSNGRLLVDAKRRVVEKPIYLGAIPIDDRSSCYAIVGDLPLLVLCILVALVSLKPRQQNYGGE